MMFINSSPLTDLEAHGLTLTGNNPEDCRVCTLIVAPALAQDADMNWGEFLALIQTYPPEYAGAWTWIRVNFDDVLEASAKLKLTECAAQEPGAAGQLYVADPSLTQEEKDILIAATAEAPNVQAEMGVI